jgi:6-phosphofructokinase 1
MLKGNAIIGQSGGPTSVINSSLCGVIETALRQDFITGVYGMRWGIEGFMKEDLIDLKKEDPRAVAALRRTPTTTCSGQTIPRDIRAQPVT